MSKGKHPEIVGYLDERDLDVMPRDLAEHLQGEKNFPFKTPLIRLSDYEALAAPAVREEPAAWMHDSPGRVDVIHAAVKKLLVDSHDTAGYLHRPLDKSEHYTVPLYAAPAAVPEGYAILPKELTAENGAKKLLIGEFYSGIEVPCPDCEGGDGSEDYDCGFCNSSGTVTERVPVSWTTIKEIWRKAAIALAAPQPAEQQPAPDVAGLVEALECALETMENVDGANDCSRGIDAVEEALAALRKLGGAV